MSGAVLGDYILDAEQQLLFRQQQEVAIEPKAFALLLYLYQQQHRYVSLEELHQQVWPGRVVSDSAVRSTIKKLRNVLDDNDLNKPRYIKSLPKRGYKLVCNVGVSADQPMSDTVIPAVAEPDILPVSVNQSEAPDLPEIRAIRPVKWLSLALLLFLSAGIIWFALPWQQETSLFTQPPLSGQLISTIPGEKRSLAVSPDGTHLAFIGRPNQSEPWQIYLMNRQTRDIRQLPVVSQQPTLLIFDDNQSLLIVDLVVDNSAIYRLQLDENMRLASEEKVAGFPFISHLSSATEEGDWLINAVDDLQGTAKLYGWNADSGEFKLLQARSSVVDHIYRSVYSPSGQRLASAVLFNASDFRLEVQDVQSKHTPYSEKIAGRVDRLEWLDEESLIVLDDKQGLVFVELASNSQRVMLEHGDEKIQDFAIVRSEQRLLVLRNEFLSEPVFHELSLSLESAADRIINVPNGVRRLNYAESEQWYFGLIKQQDKWELGKYHQFSDKTEPLFTSDNAIELLDFHPEQAALLLHDGQRLLVLNLNNKSTELVSTSQVFFDNHAAFSLDGTRVYFGQLIAGEWAAYQFERATQHSRQLVMGYRSIRETPQGFIAASALGELHQLDREFFKIQSLGHSINTEFISRWYVKNQQVIWSDFDFVSTWINQLNLDSAEFQQSRFPYEKIWPRFAINQDGSRVLVYGLSARGTNLNQVDISAYLPKNNALPLQ